MSVEERFHVIIATADGRVFECDRHAESAIGAAVEFAAEVGDQPVITNVHVRHMR